MAYDVVRQRSVLFGGTSPGVRFTDTWEWDGTSWVMTASAPSHSAPTGRAMAYDMERRQVVIWNGATWVYGVVASTQSFGNACGGVSGPPTLTSNEPNLGNPSFRLDLSSALASSPCVFGISPTGQALQIGSCALYLRELTTLLPAATSALGFATTTLPIPMTPTLIGATIYAQAFVVDPQAPVFGIAFSAGLRLVLGS